MHRLEQDIQIMDLPKSREYYEQIRQKIREQKEAKLDPHLDDIDPEQLTPRDLYFFDKFLKDDLTEKEIKEEYMRAYDKNSNDMPNNHESVGAMFLNKIIGNGKLKKKSK